MDKNPIAKFYNEMPNAQKIALLMIALGENFSAKIMSELNENEIKKISYWIDQMAHVPFPLIQKSVQEFCDRLNRHSKLTYHGGRDYINSILTQAMGKKQAKTVVSNLSEEDESDVSFILNKADLNKLTDHLKHVSSQTIALMMIYLEPQRSAKIMTKLTEEKQVEIFNSLVGLENIDKGTVKVLMQTTAQILGKKRLEFKFNPKDGIRVAAKIFQQLTADQQKQTLEKLGQFDPALVANIIPYLDVESKHTKSRGKTATIS